MASNLPNQEPELNPGSQPSAARTNNFGPQAHVVGGAGPGLHPQALNAPAPAPVPGSQQEALSTRNPESHPQQRKASTADKARIGGKAAFDKAWTAFEKLGAPVNRLTNRIGSEAFWPTSLDKESDKCARILKSFCKDGFYTEQPATPAGTPIHGPKQKPKVLVKIPQKVIQNCVGLAVFSVMRAGLWVSGAGGSGVLIAKLPDGNWSPPSGILVHTAGLGFMAGIDIYDCVCVINNRAALAAFSKLRVSIGPELSIVAGPLGVGGTVESEVLKDRKPVYSYIKSRGFYAGLQFDGTIIIERNDENARFYGERLPVGDILGGKVKNLPAGTRMMMEVAKEAEGRKDVNQAIVNAVSGKPSPGDVEVEKVTEPTKEQMEFYAPPVHRPTDTGFTPPTRTDSGFPAAPPGHLQSSAQPPQYAQEANPAHVAPVAEGYPQSSAQAPQYAPEAYPAQVAPAAEGFAPIHRTESGFAPPPPRPAPASTASQSGPPPKVTDEKMYRYE